MVRKRADSQVLLNGKTFRKEVDLKDLEAQVSDLEERKQKAKSKD